MFRIISMDKTNEIESLSFDCFLPGHMTLLMESLYSNDIYDYFINSSGNVLIRNYNKVSLSIALKKMNEQIIRTSIMEDIKLFLNKTYLYMDSNNIKCVEIIFDDR
jgi:hypothetical protein